MDNYFPPVKENDEEYEGGDPENTSDGGKETIAQVADEGGLKKPGRSLKHAHSSAQDESLVMNNTNTNFLAFPV